jgi:hypothetical protein
VGITFLKWSASALNWPVLRVLLHGGQQELAVVVAERL